MRDDSKAKAAWRRWYSRNKKEFNEKRKARYKVDPELRERLLLYRKSKYTPKKKMDDGRMPIREVAAYIGKTVSSVYRWEREGLIPRPSEGVRRYTKHQVELIRELSDAMYKGIGASKEQVEYLEFVKGKVLKEWDSESE